MRSPLFAISSSAVRNPFGIRITMGKTFIPLPYKSRLGIKMKRYHLLVLQPSYRSTAWWVLDFYGAHLVRMLLSSPFSFRLVSTEEGCLLSCCKFRAGKYLLLAFLSFWSKKIARSRKRNIFWRASNGQEHVLFSWVAAVYLLNLSEWTDDPPHL